jgi:hypothetical protein
LLDLPVTISWWSDIYDARFVVFSSCRDVVLAYYIPFSLLFACTAAKIFSREDGDGTG